MYACIAFHAQGESPTYVWVPLSKPRRRRGKNLADVVGDEPNELQVGGHGWAGLVW